MATLTEAQARQAAALTTAFKTQENREAAKIAALVALYYQRRVNVEDPRSVDRWLEIMIPRIIKRSDDGARSAAAFFRAIRQIETGDRAGVTPTLGAIDAGVRKSLLSVGPYDYMNKASDIRRLDVSPQQERAMLVQAKQVTMEKLVGATLRHAQAGSRQTVKDETDRDQIALGYVRVTRADPCFFCAALASRGLNYRAFKEESFEMSDARFTGDGDAKVHDNCGCSLKPVYATNDPLVDKTKEFADLWTEWGAGGGDAMLRFRRGYEHLRKTGERLSFEQANEGLRAA